MFTIYENYTLINEQGDVEGYKGLLKPLNDKSTGYKYYILMVEGKQKKVYVHRLIALHYLEKPKGWNDKWQVNHKNGIKTDNRLTNIEWVTQRENMLHAIKTGLKNRSSNKISDDLAMEIYLKFNPDLDNYSDFGRMYGVDRQVVRDIVTKRRYKHIHT